MVVTVGNSYSKISGFSSKQEKELKTLLSYAVDAKAAYFSSRYGPRKKSLLNKHGEFPTGLLTRVVEAYPYVELIDTRVFPKIPATTKKISMIPYTAQIKAVASAKLFKRGIISMPTGTGKSLVIALIAQALGVKTLIVVPSLEIKKQLKESLLDALKSMSNIVVENIGSPRLKTLKDFDCLIIDEAHHVAAKTYQELNKNAWNSITHRFFLTATPFRNDKDEMMLFEAIAGKIIYQLTYKDAIKEGYICPVEAYYIEITKQSTDAYTWAEVYSQLVVNNDNRNLVITNLLNNLVATKSITLCLVKEIKQGQILSEMTGLPFVNGVDEESRDYISQFNNGELPCLIATTGIMGEGVDSRACEFVIVAGLGKAKSAFMQQVGRGVRKYPGKDSCKVIIFSDKSHKFCTRHFKAQCAILKQEYGITPIKLEIE